jgi:tripartite ATP-independent transporter DctM subunit
VLDWWVHLVLLLGGLGALMLGGVPVAFAFLIVNVVGGYFYMGGFKALPQLVLSIFDSLATFVFAPVPLFILMGALMFHSGIANRALNAFDMWLGRVPGRLSLLAVLAGTMFSSLTGSSMANTAMLGSTLVPEMQRRGYSKPMSVGPILAAGALAIMIPPSSLAVLLGSLARISIADLLIAGILPGFLMAALYAVFIIGRCSLNPEVAPAYAVESGPLLDKLVATAKYILPLGIIVFLVMGVIILGIATPTEAAALGAVGTFGLAAAYGDVTWERLRLSLIETVRVTVAVFWIIAGAAAFSQILTFSGAGPGLIGFVTGLDVSPMMILLAIMLLYLFLGCFMEQLAMLMVTIPIIMPLVNTLGFDPLWFGLLVLITLEVAAISPPFGLVLFVMKGVAPKDVTMGDIYLSAMPYIVCNLIVLAIMIAFPALALWLPGLQSR